jgi:hypothetical protein
MRPVRNVLAEANSQGFVDDSPNVRNWVANPVLLGCAAQAQYRWPCRVPRACPTCWPGRGRCRSGFSPAAAVALESTHPASRVALGVHHREHSDLLTLDLV